MICLSVALVGMPGKDVIIVVFAHKNITCIIIIVYQGQYSAFHCLISRYSQIRPRLPYLFTVHGSEI